MRSYQLIKNALFAKVGESYAPVSLPHTWNARDGQDGGNDFWRGVGMYQLELPDPTAGKRQYIEIRGANHVATVWCNGRELGTHKGGFSTFRYELTDALKESGNKLQVLFANNNGYLNRLYVDSTGTNKANNSSLNVASALISMSLLKSSTSSDNSLNL